MGLVRVVRVDGDDELVPPLRPPHSQLIADTVGVLRRDLPGEEGLAYLVAEHVPVRLLLPARGGPVPTFPQEKFGVHRGRVTFISGDIFPFFRLDRVLPIVGTVLYLKPPYQPDSGGEVNKVDVIPFEFSEMFIDGFKLGQR